MEIIDINFNDLEPVHFNLGGGGGSNDASKQDTASSSSSTGGGFEFLMNTQKRTASHRAEYNLSDIDQLQSELDGLSQNMSSSSSTGAAAATSSSSSFSNFFGDTTKTFSNLFGSSSSPGPSSYSSSYSSSSSAPGANNNDSGVGAATAEARTWDGFSKVNEIPDTSDTRNHAGLFGSGSSSSSGSSNLSEREKRRKKRLMIKKLEEWYAKGQTGSSSHFTMDSPYDEVEDEYETALDDKRKKDSIKLQQWWFMTAINSVEYMNAAFNPFDLNLDGWGEQVSEDIDSYEEIFSELHEKYKGGKLSPELSLLLRIGFSAAVVNFSNKALSSATPGFNDVIRQSPELMREFTNATVKTMSQQSPGFAFAANMMNQPEKINVSFGPPAPPMETNVRSNRPDLSMARQEPMQQQQQQQPRQEMRGPRQTDIDHMLSNLKPAFDKPQQQQQQQQQEQQHPPRHDSPSNMNAFVHNVRVEDADSTISIASLKELSSSTTTGRRRPKKQQSSEAASISLDL